MKVERLWLQKQCILLARHNGGSPLDWLGVPLWQYGGWIQATNELNEKKKPKAPEKIPASLTGNKAKELFGLPGNG